MINLAQSLRDAFSRHMHRASLIVGIQIRVGQTLQIPIEQNSNEFAVLIDGGTAAVASAKITGAHKIERSNRIQRRFGWGT